MNGTGENPFAEPEDDRTVIIPREAFSALSARRGREEADDGAPHPSRPPLEAEDADFAALPAIGHDPVLIAARPLLALLARLRNVVGVPDPGHLRDRAITELRRFEAALRDARTPPEHLRLAHYALCTSLDDVVRCTPWGSHGPWADASLTSAFHKDVRGGERFFEVLGKLVASPARYLPVIELMYLCMSLGMVGQYRLSPRGPAELDRIREETYALIRGLRPAPPAELSPRWRGLSAPFRPLRIEFPIPLAILIGLGLIGLAYGAVLLGLGASEDRALAQAAGLPPLGMPVLARDAPVVAPIVPEKPGLRTMLLAALARDIADGQISVEGTELVPILRLQSDGMFAVGQATIDARFLPTMRRIAAVLSGLHGRVVVIGYTDAQPIHTVAFPSNYELSLARARAAASVFGTAIPHATITAIGRGAQFPRASNATAAGRAANRRVEIIVESTGAP